MTTVRPGPDEVIAAAPDGRLCNSRGCADAGRVADVLVTFGTFGSHWERNAIWPECWGRTYAMCDPCWEQARTVLARARPGLTVRQVATSGTPPAAPLAG